MTATSWSDGGPSEIGTSSHLRDTCPSLNITMWAISPPQRTKVKEVILLNQYGLWAGEAIKLYSLQESTVVHSRE